MLIDYIVKMELMPLGDRIKGKGQKANKFEGYKLDWWSCKV